PSPPPVAEADGRPGILGNHSESRWPRRGSPPSWWDRRRLEGRACGPVSCRRCVNARVVRGTALLAIAQPEGEDWNGRAGAYRDGRGDEAAGGLMAAWNVGMKVDGCRVRL